MASTDNANIATNNNTFPSYPKLPTELRLRIWSFAVMHPRIVVVEPQKLEPGSAWLSTTTAPAVMHACRDARAHAPYTKAFAGGEADGGVPTDGPRYVWVNFDIDMIAMVRDGDGDWQRSQPLELFAQASEAPLIQRLRIAFANDCEWRHTEFIHYLPSKLANFCRLRELQITLPSGDIDGPQDLMLGTVSYGTCAAENVRFMDPETGMLLTEGDISVLSYWEDYNGGILKEDEVEHFERYVEERYKPWVEKVEGEYDFCNHG
ncbi:hypothetical protein Micbo1qcDRAFT_236089 [Microdochium bolleyi]|uniref:2EXR domain-containing protein n=1 Tax=Microdochium bolleyi TaxID=196109 RepID=A0A136ISM9_9PEZI|nr:hypothetical protein Micbo1qcDRAFT_236089 [Microdochium bolleyi]